MAMVPHRAFCLMLAPAALLAGCSGASTSEQADMQQKLVAAEARATAAEKRARDAETRAQLHAQEPAPHAEDADKPEFDDGANDFGKPVSDTAPIEPVPAVNTEPQQQ